MVLPRGRYLDADFIEMARLSMFVRQFDDHLRVNHQAAEPVEALLQLPYARFNRSRPLESALRGATRTIVRLYRNVVAAIHDGQSRATRLRSSQALHTGSYPP